MAGHTKWKLDREWRLRDGVASPTRTPSSTARPTTPANAPTTRERTNRSARPTR